jgi:transcriptional regulator with XRE-family HTH domain
VSQPGWQERATRVIAGEVRRWRNARKLSAQQLADECKRLGFPIARSVLANLENERRETISVAELQVLAQALDVPPVLLLFPLGRAETVEALPGRDVDPWDAIEWFIGNSEDPAGASGRPQMGNHSPLILWAEHRRYDGTIPVIQRHQDDVRDARELQTSISALRRIREIMTDTGLTPPPLHPDTARILAEEPDAPVRAYRYRDPYTDPPADPYEAVAEKADDGAR